MKFFDEFEDDEINTFDGYVTNYPVGKKRSGSKLGSPISLNKMTETESLEAWFQKQADFEKYKQHLLVTLEHYIKRLTPKQQKILRLWIFENKTEKEIAKITNTSISNIRNRKRDVVKKLKQSCNK